MELILQGNIIDSDIQVILEKIRDETNSMFLKDIIRRGDNVGITCAFHKNGQENHPSCYVYARRDNNEVPFGYFRCFTCGEHGNLYKLVAKCFGCTFEEAKQWLIENFSRTIADDIPLDLPEIILEKEKPVYLDENDLEKFAYFHPYMFKRKLTKDIIIKFKIGWNPQTDAITFPIWDANGNLIGVTERLVKKKGFNIPKGMPKVIYLLNYIIKEGITEVYVVESQIDALYLWSLGIPAIALLGTGSKDQYEILKRSGIRIFHLALDGDMAGRHGVAKFIEAMPSSIMIDVLLLPDQKDINDLSLEEINSLERKDRSDFIYN